MPPVNDATKVVNFLFRPIGFRATEGKKATVDELENWVEKDSPNIVKRQPYLTLFGVIGTIVGVVAEVIGFKKDSSLAKWFGGLLTMLGLGSSGIGILWAMFIDETRGVDVGKASTNDPSKAGKKGWVSPNAKFKEETEGKDENAILEIAKQYLLTKTGAERDVGFNKLLQIGSEEALYEVVEYIKGFATESDKHQQSIRFSYLKLLAKNEQHRQLAKDIIDDLLKDEKVADDFKYEAREILDKYFK